MNTEIFFTLTEYKSNFERLKKEFIDAYIDNDDVAFISLEIGLYQRCLENTKVDYGILADGVGWDTKAMMTGENFVWEVDKKVRTKDGGLNKEIARNLNVSFNKIIDFLHEEKINSEKIETDLSACQWALYYYVLQECKLKPRFKFKVKEIEELSKEFGISPKTFQTKYNLINNSNGLEGYRQVDVDVVEKLMEEKHHNIAVEYLQKLTLHIT